MEKIQKRILGFFCALLLQLTTQQFTLQFFRLRGEKQTPAIFILCFYKTLRQLNNTRNATSSYESLGSRRHFAFSWRHADVLYFTFVPNTKKNLTNFARLNFKFMKNYSGSIWAKWKKVLYDEVHITSKISGHPGWYCKCMITVYASCVLYVGYVERTECPTCCCVYSVHHQ